MITALNTRFKLLEVRDCDVMNTEVFSKEWFSAKIDCEVLAEELALQGHQHPLIEKHYNRALQDLLD